jgi:hypothetical protein
LGGKCELRDVIYILLLPFSLADCSENGSFRIDRVASSVVP